jgi:hypothetical protein
MATKQRAADLGLARGRAIMAELAREVRVARRDRGLSLADVGRAVGSSQPAMTRFEQAVMQDVGIVRASRVLSVVGLELSARAYPGGQPLRDAGHARLLRQLRSAISPTLGWGTEVPLPGHGDRRAWDALIRGPGWRYGVEAETHPTDAQALIRRLELKQRDGDVTGVLLVLPASRQARLFLAAAGDLLAPVLPVDGRHALELLAAGLDPGGGSVVVLQRE